MVFGNVQTIYSFNLKAIQNEINDRNFQSDNFFQPFRKPEQ